MKNKKYEELKFCDDFMFSKVMQDEELCKDLLECLLQRKVEKLEPVVPQREFRYTSKGKPIRLDIYTKDSKRIYDVEMQNKNQKSLEILALPKRSRFYQSVIDTDFLEKNHKYWMLPDTEIIFMCTFDPFCLGDYKYTFSEVRIDGDSLDFGSGTNKYFFNCTYVGDNIPDDINHLFRYIQFEEVSDDLTKRIDDAVQKARMREEWRSEYMKGYLREYDVMMDGIAIGREEGLQKGISVGRIQEAIESAIEYGIARKDVITKLIKKFNLDEEQANELYDKYSDS